MVCGDPIEVHLKEMKQNKRLRPSSSKEGFNIKLKSLESRANHITVESPVI